MIHDDVIDDDREHGTNESDWNAGTAVKMNVSLVFNCVSPTGTIVVFPFLGGLFPHLETSENFIDYFLINSVTWFGGCWFGFTAPAF